MNLHKETTEMNKKSRLRSILAKQTFSICQNWKSFVAHNNESSHSKTVTQEGEAFLTGSVRFKPPNFNVGWETRSTKSSDMRRKKNNLHVSLSRSIF